MNTVYPSLILSALLVVANIFVHYEMLRIFSVVVPKLAVAVRVKILLVVLGCFLAHTIEVWLYALAYLFISRAGLGALEGKVEGYFADYLYFSATSYSTLGFGDVYPVGALRIVSGVEGLNGLFLIAWSTSFTYFVMDRMWPLHPEVERRDRKLREEEQRLLKACSPATFRTPTRQINEISHERNIAELVQKLTTLVCVGLVCPYGKLDGSLDGASLRVPYSRTVVVIWGITGPIFRYSDTWQLVINTGTTIVTFLMAFLIQNNQNRDTLALQVKLAELIFALKEADNGVAAIEDASDEELH